MKLNQLRYVLEVDRCKSFNTASLVLFLSQPSLSKSVSDLEKELNIKIFNRTNRGVTTTLQGTKLILFAQRILSDVSLIENKKFLSHSNISRFHLSAVDNSFVITAYHKFCLEQNTVDKKLDYCLNISSPFEIVENVLSNYYDLGIIMISNLQREFWLKMLKNKQMVFIPIEAFDPQVLLGKTHPLAKEDAIEVSLLKEYPHVFYDAIVDGNLNYIAEQKQLGIYESSTKVRANDRSLMFDLIKDLGGYSIGFGNNDEYFDSYGIRCVPIVDVDIHFEIGYIKNESIPLSRISEKFITVLKQAITSGYAP